MVCSVGVLVCGSGSSTVVHEHRDSVVDWSVLGATSPEHGEVLGDGQEESAERVVLGAGGQPALVLVQREAYRRETIDCKDHENPDRRVTAV